MVYSSKRAGYNELIMGFISILTLYSACPGSSRVTTSPSGTCPDHQQLLVVVPGLPDAGGSPSPQGLAQASCKGSCLAVPSSWVWVKVVTSGTWRGIWFWRSLGSVRACPKAEQAELTAEKGDSFPEHSAASAATHVSQA